MAAQPPVHLLSSPANLGYRAAPLQNLDLRSSAVYTAEAILPVVMRKR